MSSTKSTTSSKNGGKPALTTPFAAVLRGLYLGKQAARTDRVAGKVASALTDQGFQNDVGAVKHLENAKWWFEKRDPAEIERIFESNAEAFYNEPGFQYNDVCRAASFFHLFITTAEKAGSFDMENAVRNADVAAERTGELLRKKLEECREPPKGKEPEKTSRKKANKRPRQEDPDDVKDPATQPPPSKKRSTEENSSQAPKTKEIPKKEFMLVNVRGNAPVRLPKGQRATPKALSEVVSPKNVCYAMAEIPKGKKKRATWRYAVKIAGEDPKKGDKFEILTPTLVNKLGLSLPPKSNADDAAQRKSCKIEYAYYGTTKKRGFKLPAYPDNALPPTYRGLTTSTPWSKEDLGNTTSVVPTGGNGVVDVTIDFKSAEKKKEKSQPAQTQPIAKKILERSNTCGDLKSKMMMDESSESEVEQVRESSSDSKEVEGSDSEEW